MANLAPLGGVYQAGTLSGNPLATAAGLATLAHLDAVAYERLTATAVRLQEGLERAFADAGVPAVVPRVGSLLGLFFTADTPRDFDEADVAARNGVYPRFFHGMLERGIALAPGPYEAIFVGLAHDDEAIDTTVAAARAVAAELAAG
jgi:glutamate-1-semialdehyde 2,1-aminomutase